MNLQNKRALVSGGTRGIGKAIVYQLAQQGCKIVFTYHSSDAAANQIEKDCVEKNYSVYGFKADGSSFSDCEKTINFILEKFGGLDILVNNAGITKDNLLLRMSEDDFDKVISANLKSVFNYSKLAVKSMVTQRWGRIINISSVVGINGNAGQSNYAASKSGIVGFSKSIAKEFASRNITVNVIAPGFISTDMTEKLNDKQRESIIASIPLKKIGTPENIAKAVSFLASDDADYITGQILAIDGGMTM